MTLEQRRRFLVVFGESACLACACHAAGVSRAAAFAARDADPAFEQLWRQAAVRGMRKASRGA